MSTHVVSDAQRMVAEMAPVRRDGAFCFCTLTVENSALLAHAIGTFREAEGLSLILPVEHARAAGLPVDQPMACITLSVFSALEGVGLTAAVATTLADAGIACNMVAAFHHDHAFVPYTLAEKALDVLRRRAAADGGV